MSDLFEWPALRTDRHFLELFIEYERGVWGKAHGASTDYLWIARSEDFGRDQPDLRTQLNLGAEDRPACFQAWRCLGDRCYAVTAYPSRAIDAAGRRGFLEKQVLEWRVPPGTPALLGAFLLLPHVAGMTDAIWWDRPAGNQPISAADRQPLLVDTDVVRDAVERGRRTLLELVPVPALQNFFDQLQAGNRPASVAGLSEPLPAEALLALLLPLPREIADRLSIAGWIPTSRPSFDDLSARWDAVVIPESAPRLPLIENAESQRMIELLRGERNSRPLVSSSRRSRPLPSRPGLQLDLTPPQSGSPHVMLVLHEFACDVDRRWLTPSELHDGRSVPRISRVEAALICEWAEEVQRQRPTFADLQQWSLKVDLLRSAARLLAGEDLFTLRTDERLRRWLMQWPQRPGGARSDPQRI